LRELSFDELWRRIGAHCQDSPTDHVLDALQQLTSRTK
jgi:hypothetical protein